MSFRDKIASLISEDKRKDAEAIFDELDSVLDGYSRDVRELKRSLREKDGIKPEEFASLEKENQTLKDQLSEQSKALKKAELEGKALSEKLVGEQNAINRLVLEDGLTKGLTELGITKPAMVAAARALLKDKGILSVKTDGEARAAIAKLKKDGKDLELDLGAYLKDWAGSDEGKEFIPASGNGGSGSGKPQGKAGDKVVNRSDWEGMKPAEQVAFVRDGGKIID